MEIVAGIAFVLAVVLVAYLDHAARKREQSRRQEAGAEKERKRLCSAFIDAFSRNYSYLDRHVLHANELHSLAETGENVSGLRKKILAAVHASGAIILGHDQGNQNDLPIVLPDGLRDKHVYVVGKSGFGKTTFLRSLIAQDLERGSGLAVIAPEAELILEEILPIIPESRIDDVIYFNPADTTQPVVLNPLHVFQGDVFDLHIDETLTVLRRVTDEGGPRMNHILHSALYALSERPGSTLLDFAPLLDRKNDSLRKEIIENTSDDLTRAFFANEYPQMPADSHLPILNRLGRIVRSEFVRNCLCPPQDTSLPQGELEKRLLSIRRVMDEGKIVLFNLSDGIVGKVAGHLIGQLVVAKFQTAIMSRADTPKHLRKRYYLYLDEFQNFCGSSVDSYKEILSRARKYGLGLILAHQQTDQLPQDLLHETFGNASTIVSFRVSHPDATRLAKEMFPGSYTDRIPTFMKLEIGETVCSVDGSTYSMRTPPQPDVRAPEKVRRIIERSRELYGIPRQLRRARDHKDPPREPDALTDLDPGDVF